MVHFNVIIDIGPGSFPFGINIGMSREGFEHRFFKGLEQDLAGSFELLKGALIESMKFLCHRLFKLAKAKEGSVSQWSQNPALHLEHSRFDLGFGVVHQLHKVRNMRSDFFG
jgi:hypothetical protein